MAAGLIQVATSKHKNKAVTKTYLFNTDRILDMKDNSSGLCEFYFDNWPADLKDLPDRFTCTTYNTGNLHWNIKLADTTNSRFYLNVLYETRVTGGRQVTIDDMVKIFTDQIIYGFADSDGLNSYLIIHRGSNVYRLKVSHTLDDIVRTSSKSESLSRSAL